MATGLSNAICKDGQTTVTADIPLGTNKITGLKAGTALTDASNLGQAQNAAFAWAGTSGGSANAQTLTMTPAITSYVAGQTFRFKAGFSNSGATTIAINGLAAIAAQANGSAMVGGEIVAGQFYEITLDTATTIQVLKIGPAAGSGSITASGYTQNTNRILGRNTVGAGAVEELAVTGATISAGALTVTPDRSELAGLTLSTAGGSTTISIAAGSATDSTNASTLTIAAFTKTTASFVAGSGNGALDTGVSLGAASTWYHLYIISTAGGVLTDILMSLSATSPTMPATYTLFRRIGSAKLDGSKNWTAFTQTGDNFRLSASVLDVSVTNPGTSAVTGVLASVPSGIKVFADINYSAWDTGGVGGIISYVSPLIASDEAPTQAASAPAFNSWAGSNVPGASQLSILTDTSQSIRYRLQGSGAGTTVKIVTLGWNDRRGRDA